MNRRETLRLSIEYVAAAARSIHDQLDADQLDAETRSGYVESFDAGMTAIDGWTAELAELEARDARVRNLPTASAAHRHSTETVEDLHDVRTVDVGGRPREARQNLRDRAMAVLERTADEFGSTENVDRVERMLRRQDPNGGLAATLISTTDPDYVRAFALQITGQSYRMDEVERRALERAVNVGTGSAGGFAVPTFLDPTIISTRAGTVNPLRQLASVTTLPMGNVWTGVSRGGITAAMAAEADEVTEGSPTYAAPTVTPNKAHAYAKYSDEALQDIDGLVADLMEAFGDAKDDLEATQMVTGAGTGNNTRGLVTALVADTTPVASASSDAFAAADMYALRADVPARYRPAGNFSWLMAQEIADLVRQFGTAVNHAFTVDLSADSVERVLGRPVFEVSAMDSAINAAAENYLVIGGDIRSAYKIVDVVGMVAKHNPIVISTANNRPTGEEGIYVSWRFGGNLVNASAARILNVT